MFILFYQDNEKLGMCSGMWGKLPFDKTEHNRCSKNLQINLTIIYTLFQYFFIFYIIMHIYINPLIAFDVELHVSSNGIETLYFSKNSSVPTLTGISAAEIAFSIFSSASTI